MTIPALFTIATLAVMATACTDSRGDDSVLIKSVATDVSVEDESAASDSPDGGERNLRVRVDGVVSSQKTKPGKGKGKGPDGNGPPRPGHDNDQTTTSTAGTTSTAEGSSSSTTGTTATTASTTSTSSTTSQSSTTTTTRQSTTTTSIRTTTTTTTPPTMPTQGNLVHVDIAAPSGGDGTAARPFRRLEDGLKAVDAGETLVVHGGEYRERINLGSLAQGTASQPIRVTAASGERVLVKGRLRLRGLRHWTITGINVTWDVERNSANEHMVVLTDGANWEFRNAEIWGARSYAGLLVAGNPTNWALRYLHIHDTYPTNDTNQDHLIYCNCGNGGGTIERNLLVGSDNGRAIKFGTVNADNVDIANVVVRYNTMVDNRGPSNVQLSYRTSNIVIEHNIMVRPAAGRENVTTYRLGGSGSVVRNNIGWESDGVVATHPGVSDGGGNRLVDPQLNNRYAPQNPEIRNYGHLAP